MVQSFADGYRELFGDMGRVVGVSMYIEGSIIRFAVRGESSVFKVQGEVKGVYCEEAGITSNSEVEAFEGFP